MQVTVAFIVSIFLLGITGGILIAVVVNSIKFSNELNNILGNTKKDKKKENIKNSNSEHREITKNICNFVVGEAQSPFNGKIFTYYKKDGDYVKSGENILLYTAKHMEYKVKAPIDGYLKYVYFKDEIVYGQETLFVITNKPCV